MTFGAYEFTQDKACGYPSVDVTDPADLPAHITFNPDTQDFTIETDDL